MRKKGREIRVQKSENIFEVRLQSKRLSGKVIGIMLLRYWERLRGYDRWPQVEGTIQSSRISEEGADQIRGNGEQVYEWRSTNVLVWKDLAGESHSAEFDVSEDSPLFQLYDGQTVPLRFNPANPDEFYLPAVLRSRVAKILKWQILPAILVIVYLVVMLALRITGSRLR